MSHGMGAHMRRPAVGGTSSTESIRAKQEIFADLIFYTSPLKIADKYFLDIEYCTELLSRALARPNIICQTIAPLEANGLCAATIASTHR